MNIEIKNTKKPIEYAKAIEFLESRVKDIIENNSDFMKDLDYSPNEKIINKIKIFSRSNFNNKLKVSRSSLNKFIKLFGKEFSSSIKIQ